MPIQNGYIEEIKRLRAENERLKNDNANLKAYCQRIQLIIRRAAGEIKGVME